MKNRFKLLSLLAFGSITLSGCYIDLGFIKIGSKEETNTADGKLIYDAEKQNAHILEYYSTIDSSQSGDTLLSALRTLNLGKRKSEVGYSEMGSNSSGKVKFTDYDPAYVKFNSDGIPYGTRILSFYSGKSVTTFDREHVWPASRLSGGRDNNIVDDDILMPRPTCSEENQDRGNSAYVTGVADGSSGWDPVTAFEKTLGTYEGIRGECARIIFYCCLVDSRCQITDSAAYEGYGVPKMGKISDLMEWACENPVNMREKRRQVGAEYLQGNRNAFVDHPEYACKIWGTSSDRARAACKKANYPVQ